MRVFIALTTVLLSCTFPVQPARPAPPERVRVGIYDAFPLTYTDGEGRARGVLVEILEYVADREDWTLTYVPASWTECLRNLETGRIDLLGAIAFTPERAERFDYTYESPIAEWGQIYVRKGTGVESVLDLAGRKVAVLMEDLHYLHLRRQLVQFGIQSRFIEAFEYEDVLALVDAGRCDAGLVSHFYGMENARRFDVRETPIVLSPQRLFWAAGKGRSGEVLDRLDSRLRQLKADEGSFYYETLDKWFGGARKSAVARWAGWVAAGLGVLLLGSVFVIALFRSRVRARTRELSEKNRQLEAEIAQRRRAEAERAALEARLLRARKMEALGTLAGGVAHDLNNILSGVVTYPELLLMDLPPDSPLKKPLLTIKGSGEKAARIVQDLLTLARRGVATTEAVNVNTVVRDYLESPECRKLLDHHPTVRVECVLAPDLGNVMGSAVHLSKTVMNLVSNAAEAMPGGGRVSIRTENRTLEAPVRGYEDVEAGQYVVLSVADQGLGISPEEIDRIFEPFYTKKVMGRSGTGLGMAVVWGTVKDHRGYIDVESREEAGTVFTLYLPATRASVRPGTGPAALDELMGRGERILVVDDVVEQREIASRMLRRLGYAVETVPSGEAALEHLRQRTADLVILDMIMEPGIDGLETFRRMRKIRPGQRAVITSGYSETQRVKATQSEGASGYLRKPYSLEQMARAVHSALGDPGP